jgi:hypothetical protein
MNPPTTSGSLTYSAKPAKLLTLLTLQALCSGVHHGFLELFHLVFLGGFRFLPLQERSSNPSKL